MSVQQARQLRRRMSQPEALLWRFLRARPEGLQFRRQHPLGPYVLDFFCRAAGLAIEIDGFAHGCAGAPERDSARDRWVREQGIDTLRIPAIEVQDNLEGVVRYIVGRYLERAPPPRFARSPSPSNDGEDAR